MTCPNKDLLLSIVIVNWNSWDYLKKCLESIRQYVAEINVEVVVVDNASGDHSVANIQTFFPEVKLIALEKNYGFPKANNLGFAQTRGKYLLALNPDTEIKAGTLQLSLKFLEEHPEYGCVGVKSLHSSGEIQISCARKFPSLTGIVLQLMFLDKIFPKINLEYNMDMPAWDHQSSRDVDMIAGFYMMFPRSLYKEIGGFDERVLMFLEDIEYCIRIWDRGYKIRYLADVEIVHHGGKSTDQAVPDWISFLRYEAYYVLINDLYSPKVGNQFPYLLLIFLPIKLMMLPFLCYWLYMKKKERRLSLYFFETLGGLKWCMRKIFGNYSRF